MSTTRSRKSPSKKSRSHKTGSQKLKEEVSKDSEAEFEMVPAPSKRSSPRKSKAKSPSKRSSPRKSPKKSSPRKSPTRRSRKSKALNAEGEEVGVGSVEEDVMEEEKPVSRRRSPSKALSRSRSKRPSQREEAVLEEEVRASPRSRSHHSRSHKSPSPSKVPHSHKTAKHLSRSHKPRANFAAEDWVRSPVSQKWIIVGGATYERLYPEHEQYFLNTTHRKAGEGEGLSPEKGCGHVRKYEGEEGPFCGPEYCGGHTYPVRSQGEYRAAMSYARFAKGDEPQKIRACAERVREQGFKGPGRSRNTKAE